ncbi:MAG: helix-turn-helix domain-containing protein [Planctomycetes bacterium]|nr:helix-turn-helix domain-containing protein [Planctomycetota bacterium]
MAELPNTPAVNDQLLSKKATAVLLGVSVRTIERAILAGSISPVRIGWRVMLRASDVERAQNDGLETGQRESIAIAQ